MYGDIQKYKYLYIYVILRSCEHEMDVFIYTLYDIILYLFVIFKYKGMLLSGRI